VCTKSNTNISNLVERCRNGEGDAWEELIDRVAPVVFGICGRMRLSREESFDIFGQVSYLLLKKLGSLKSAEKVLTYVATMTRREIYALNRKSKIIQHLGKYVTDDIHDLSGNSPEDIFEATRRSEAVMKAISLLPIRDYLLIKALFFDSSNPSYEEIAGRLKVGVSSIGPLRARSLEKLKRIFERKKLLERASPCRNFASITGGSHE
jgi:RNA polymerase sigma factor (sigma-70 family)